MKQNYGASSVPSGLARNTIPLASNLLSLYKDCNLPFLFEEIPLHTKQWLGDTVPHPFPTRISNIGICFLDII